MPVISIKSLPLEPQADIPRIVSQISSDFSSGLGIDSEHITVTWELINSQCYSVAGKLATTQPIDRHPILVDLLAPDFNSNDQAAKMLVVLASSISKHTAILASNIFINYREAHSGFVFDHGEIVKW